MRPSLKKRHCVALAVAMMPSAFAWAATRSQNFNSDPGWLREGDPDNNPTTPHPSNYGFRMTDITGNTVNPPGGTATADGEAGGIIGSEVPSSYGDNIGQVTPKDYLTMSGVLHMATHSQELTFGWYNSDQTPPSPATPHRPNLLGFQTVARSGTEPVAHSVLVYLYGAGGAEIRNQTGFRGDETAPGEPPNRLLTGTTYPFSFTWDPNGGTNALGSMTLFIDGVNSDDSTPSDFTFTSSLNAGNRALLDSQNLVFDRFGMSYSIYKPDGASPEEAYLDDLTYSIGPSITEWNVNGGGNWSPGGNWTAGLPNAADHVARFGAIITAPVTVTNDAAHTVRTIQFDNANSYTIAGPGTLTLAPGATIDVVQGSHTVSAPLALGANFGAIVPGGSTLTLENVQSSAFNFAKHGAGKLVVNGVRAAGRLNVNGGELEVMPSGNSNANLSRVGLLSVNVAAGAKLDLTDNKVITTSGLGTWNGTNYTGVSGLVDSGRGPAGNALWDGPGVVTSDTRAINNGDLVSIGVIDASDKFPIAETDTAVFAGQTVLGSDTLVMVTWGGDANLDGKINIDDYGRIDGNVGQSGSVFGWSRGDFNYDGKINIDDYGIIDGNINRQGAAFPTAGAPDAVSAVPEPGAAALMALFAAGMFQPCRRRCRRA